MYAPQHNKKSRSGYWKAGLLPLALVLLSVGYTIRSLKFHQPTVPLTFDEVLGQRRPAGVSEVMGVQRQMFIKQWAWLRFRASDTAIKSLLHKAERIEDPETIQWMLAGATGVPSDKYKAVDKEAVRWREVSLIKKPEFYRITSYSTTISSSWIAELIFDREKHLVYVHAYSD